MKQIILASTSPRRKEIFEKTRLPFIVEKSDYEEDMTLPLSPIELAKFLSLKKAEAVAEKYSDAIIIAADTFVAFEGKVLGKPHTREKAKAMLQMLNGKCNQVLTSVTIIEKPSGKVTTFCDEAKIYFKTLSESEIDMYVASGEPIDKAGAYAIQGLGSVFVEKIEGDFFGVMGLPISKVVDELKNFGINVL